MTQHQPVESQRHNAAFRRGCALIKDLIRISDRPVRSLSWLDTWRLKRAIREFHKALQINPGGWPSMWNLGQVYQRLGDHREALKWFEQSYELAPNNPDVAREAGVEALEVGDFSAAAAFFKSAIRANADDPGHQANLALAELLLGDVENASRAAH